MEKPLTPILLLHQAMVDVDETYREPLLGEALYHEKALTITRVHTHTFFPPYVTCGTVVVLELSKVLTSHILNI